METTWLERLTNPELVFGLVVRFFGVFIVLIIVMIGIWVVGRLFMWREEAERKKNAGAPSEGQPVAKSDSVGPEETAMQVREGPVPEEVAAVVALHLQESAEGIALVSSGGPVQAEVAAVISLSLARHLGEQGFQTSISRTPMQESSLRDRESPWKILGRQETFSRRNPLPQAGVGTWRGR